MIKDVILLNGDVINIGPWDYMYQDIEVSPEETDEHGSITKPALFEKKATNPLPEEAEIIQMEVAEDSEGGLRIVERNSNISTLKRLQSWFQSKE